MTARGLAGSLLAALLVACAPAELRAQCQTGGASWDRTRVAGLPDDAQLEASGAVIGDIRVSIANIFDLDAPGEDIWLARTANRLHRCTREWALREQLLFEPGDPYVARILLETERTLRAIGNYYDAVVRPVRYDGRAVDIEVVARDVWTLEPELGYSHTGGETEYEIGISDSNTLGTGKGFELVHESNIDRDTNLVSYIDSHLLGSRVRMSALYADNSDGSRAAFSAERPFYALDTRWAAGGELSTDERVDSLYDLGEVVAEFRHDERFAQAQYGWSRGLVDGWVRRWSVGASYEDDAFAPEPGVAPVTLPEERTLVYPWIALDLFEDRYWSLRNRGGVNRMEDLYVGTQLRAQVGWSTSALGADRDAGIFSLYGARGFGRDTRKLLLLSGWVNGRVEDGGLRNGILDLYARYYHEFGTRQRFYSRLSVTATEHLDAENQLLLGGDNGLRGYPVRYQGGETRALLSFEHVVYTDWYPFGFARLGAAGFFDVGRTWGDAPFSSPSLGWLSDIGAGLRLNPARATRHVIHFDLAFPLDGDDSIDDVQVIIGTEGSF